MIFHHLKVEAIHGGNSWRQLMEAIDEASSFVLPVLYHELPRVSTRGLMEQSKSMPQERYFALRIVGHTDAKSEAMCRALTWNLPSIAMDS
jgi:hypothetical protein